MLAKFGTTPYFNLHSLVTKILWEKTSFLGKIFALKIKKKKKRSYNLKLASTIFYQIFIFLPNDSPSKAMKCVFYFIQKAFFVLELLNFCNFFPSFLHFPDTKGHMEVE